MERLVEDGSFVGDHYAYSAGSDQWRLVNDELRPGEQVRRPRAVNAIKRKDIKGFAIDENVRERFVRNFQPSLKMARIRTTQTIALSTALASRP